MNKIILLLAIFIISAACFAAKPITIAPGAEIEKDYLVDQVSALNETGIDPSRPFIRIADGYNMYYIYKFTAPKNSIAYTLLWLRTQFLVSISTNKENWTPVADIDKNETIGTRTLVDFTPYLKNNDTIYLKFEDKYKQDGWGSLLHEIKYYKEGGNANISRLDIPNWTVNGKTIAGGNSIDTSNISNFETTINIPKGWNKLENALYLPKTIGTIKSVTINNKTVDFGKTWDMGVWSDVSKALAYGKENKISIQILPQDGKAAIYSPARIGIKNTACASPSIKTIDGTNIEHKKTQAPYTYDKMNYIVGNYTNYLFDERYNLLAFEAAERMTVHYLHDTCRNICALAEEERFTPAVRLELVRKLYQGIKGGIMPGGEFQMSFKHDERPVDIRPYEETPKLTLVQKMDLWLYVATIGVSTENRDGSFNSIYNFKDTKLSKNTNQKKWNFTRTWNSPRKEIKSFNEYYLGGTDTPPVFNFKFSGKGKSQIDLGGFTKDRFWFRPGTWGPEAIVTPDGKAVSAADGYEINNPDFDYLLIRGGNGTGATDVPDYTGSNSVLIMWDKKPERIYADINYGEKIGRCGAEITDLHLIYPEDTKDLKIHVIPFMGMPESQKTPIAIAQNIQKTGKYGMGIYDAHVSLLLNGIGPDGLAAAAYLFDKYNTPEADEARNLALQAMRAFVKNDEAGARTQELYYILKACTYMKLLGYDEFDKWAKIWADRILAVQKEDGSWVWLNWQLRNMTGLLHAYELLGDEKYLKAVEKGLTTIKYENGNLFWNGEINYYDDFSGALTINLYGYLNDLLNAQNSIDARLRYINDGGYSACSDLNPYMLGMSAKGMNLSQSPIKNILGLKDSVIYDKDKIISNTEPTAHFINLHHPITSDITFKLEE